MLHLDTRIVKPHILNFKKLHVRIVGPAGELLGVDNKIDALDNHLVIFLRRISRRCRLDHKVVGDGINFMWRSMFGGIRQS